jgi:hypothetical protein
VGSVVRAHVNRLDPALEETIADIVESIVGLRENTIASMTAHQPVSGSVDCIAALDSLISLDQRIAADITRLEKEDSTKALESLDLERQTLRHREVLSQLIGSIEKFVVDAAWCAKAEMAKSALNPRAVTTKEKELFTQIIGESYRTRLADECASLDCTLPIELQTAGQKGKTVRSIRMKGGHKPDIILSEGEQKAVALADFLTEVAMSPANAGIVLDDPVTSQDHYRKELIAKRLVREANARQVIVFTHDLPFLTQLIVQTEAEDVTYQAHWIDRDDDGNPGVVKLNDLPVISKMYDTSERARQCLAEAQSLSGSARHDAICKGMGALRRTIEEVVVKRLFKDVVPRWSDQVRVTALRKISWDNVVVDQMCVLYEELSRYIEGHSHTDEAMGAPPEIKDLEAMIARVDGLIRSAKPERKATPAAALVS